MVFACWGEKITLFKLKSSNEIVNKTMTFAFLWYDANDAVSKHKTRFENVRLM